MESRIRPALVFIALTLATASLAIAQPVTKSTLSDVAFIGGVWQGQMDEAFIEEIWSAPKGDQMAGMFRLVDGGKGQFYEFMLLEQGPDGVYLKLRHFSPHLVAWEDKEGALTFPLTSWSPALAVFELEDKSRVLTYSLSDDSILTVTLDEIENGKTSSQSFVFTRGEITN